MSRHWTQTEIFIFMAFTLQHKSLAQNILWWMTYGMTTEAWSGFKRPGLEPAVLL